MMKKSQRLMYELISNRYEKIFLLMADEAEEFKALVESHGLPFAFERITGYSTENIHKIKLEQIFHY